MRCYDLHCHSTASDGRLAPAEVVARAAANGVDVLSLTDHDTLAGWDEAVAAAEGTALRLVAGVEFSSRWENLGVHVVGLALDPQSAPLSEAVQRQRAVRDDRAERIAAALERAGLPPLLDAARAVAGDAIIGRPHFARAMVQQGVVSHREAAFRRWLGAGRPGDVRELWPELGTIVGWIRAAGGQAVLAHPCHYGLSRNRRQKLISAFKEAGGAAVEVISGRQDPEQIRILARDTAAHGLAGSVGSDFHGPGPGVADLGEVGMLPAMVQPVWEAWQGDGSVEKQAD